MSADMSSVPDTLLRDSSLSDSMERCGWDRRSGSVVEAKDHAVQRLQDQLRQVGQELRLKGKEQRQLESLRDQLECEIDDLTANLFENANKLVVDANVKRMNVEKEFELAQTTVSELQADIRAIKTLISSNENKESQEISKPKTPPSIKKKFSFSRIKKFQRSRSQQHIRLDSPSSDTDSLCNSILSAPPKQPELLEDMEEMEEFKTWRASPELSDDSPFIKHLIVNDVQPCFNFADSHLRDTLVKEVISNSLSIEPIKEQQQLAYCKLIDAETICSHVVKVENTDDPLYISSSMRDKIITACELFLYLSYVKQGLIKSTDDNKLFEQIQLLRRNMVLQRLGFSLPL